ncbi:hypothetical protein G4D82_09770 [Flavobacterium sp. CYK-4]|uniref:hypothetical protein n=1 Tax=Flavobacterium lotistagni TaxID=2709660 RepID=UPI00140C0428|nr:hypothetical protein [Flavobacterium lotistagni]NHM07507.1 hypothetical protein [Flavobacterium lotistagni]
MKIVKQLLKEFWLPLTVAIIWTIINICNATKPQKWTDYINVAMPTFFFVSWMTGQYFRVRKQEQVSTSLSKIEGRVESVLSDISNQTKEMKFITDTQVVQTFDLCIDYFREAKEELSDKSRLMKKGSAIDETIFELYRENPFYQSKRFLNRLINYAAYTSKLDKPDDLKERYTRTTYHVEELAGIITSYINRMNQFEIKWKTEKSKDLLKEIAFLMTKMQNEILPLSKYSTEKYKGNDLRKVLNTHISNLTKFAE